VSVRRRRGLLLLALALASGGLAASQVHRREQRVEAQVGPLVPVLVAARDIPAGSRIPSGALERRRVPARFVPPDAMSDTADVAGARTAAGLAAGSYVTAGHLSGEGGAAAAPGGRATATLRDGERALEIAVSGGAALAQASAGARVDVVVSSERADGAGRSFVALEDVELLGLRPADGSSGLETGEDEPASGGALPATGTVGAPGADADGAAASAAIVATLRVSLRQAVYLTAAENFGREVRLLVRPPGDRRRTGGAAVGEDEL
jgi:pilus assembly protein CpaB